MADVEEEGIALGALLPRVARGVLPQAAAGSLAGPSNRSVAIRMRS